MKRFYSLALILVFVPNVSFAIPVLEGTHADPTGIRGLRIGTNTYDVAFSRPNESYDSFYTTPPVTLSSGSGPLSGPAWIPPSDIAAVPLTAALNGLGVDGLAGILLPDIPPNVGFGFLIPTFYDGLASTGVFINPQLPFGWVCCGGYYGFPTSVDPATQQAGPPSNTFEYVSFSQAVPEPDTLALLGLGVLIIRKRKRSLHKDSVRQRALAQFVRSSDCRPRFRQPLDALSRT